MVHDAIGHHRSPWSHWGWQMFDVRPGNLAPLPLLRNTRATETRAFAPHSITPSAVASTDDGTVMPRALAILRFITSSNLVGCSMGRSPGLAPRKILST